MMIDVRHDPATVYAEHATELIRYATVLVGPSAAEDLVADAVIAAFSSPAWTTVEHPRAYLYRAVLNAAHHTHRSHARRVVRERRAATAESVEPTLGDPTVVAALQQLTPRQRAVVFFTYWQDRPSAEIADDLGTDQRTVQRDLLAARTRLAQLLQ